MRLRAAFASDERAGVYRRSRSHIDPRPDRAHRDRGRPVLAGEYRSRRLTQAREALEAMASA